MKKLVLLVAVALALFAFPATAHTAVPPHADDGGSGSATVGDVCGVDGAITVGYDRNGNWWMLICRNGRWEILYWEIL